MPTPPHPSLASPSRAYGPICSWVTKALNADVGHFAPFESGNKTPNHCGSWVAASKPSQGLHQLWLRFGMVQSRAVGKGLGLHTAVTAVCQRGGPAALRPGAHRGAHSTHESTRAGEDTRAGCGLRGSGGREGISLTRVEWGAPPGCGPLPQRELCPCPPDLGVAVGPAVSVRRELRARRRVLASLAGDWKGSRERLLAALAPK